jgi:hypothetical protein
MFPLSNALCNTCTTSFWLEISLTTRGRYLSTHGALAWRRSVFASPISALTMSVSTARRRRRRCRHNERRRASVTSRSGCCRRRGENSKNTSEVVVVVLGFKIFTYIELNEPHYDTSIPFGFFTTLRLGRYATRRARGTNGDDDGDDGVDALERMRDSRLLARVRVAEARARGAVAHVRRRGDDGHQRRRLRGWLRARAWTCGRMCSCHSTTIRARDS